ncbi:MAG: restriction endonuclease, partial [Blastocatellales bacterium]
ASSSYSDFAILCSHLHYWWVIEKGSSMRTDPVYTPSDCFETFTFPEFVQNLEDIGNHYESYRRSVIEQRQEGLTKIYNRFHDPSEKSADIERLRQLHVEMDQHVAEAYGWRDLDLGHGFHQTKQGVRFTISEAARVEVLDLLLALNHERYAEEVAAGLHVKGAKKKKAKMGVKKHIEPSTPEANQMAPGKEKLFDYEKQESLFD